MSPARLTPVALGLLVAAAAPGGARAADPSLEVRVAAGVAVPTGGAATRRGPGPAVLVSVGAMPQPIAWRLELTWDLLDGPPVNPAETWASNTADVSILGVTAGGVLGPWRSPVSPYLAVGLGAYWMQRVGGDPSPYGITYGAHAALGLDLTVDLPVRPFLELRGLLHATDYGSQEWSPTVYVTARGGLRFEW